MKIKTFPINYIDFELEKVGKYARHVKETKEEFIKKSVEERMKRIGELEEE